MDQYGATYNKNHVRREESKGFFRKKFLCIFAALGV